MRVCVCPWFSSTPSGSEEVGGSIGTQSISREPICKIRKGWFFLMSLWGFVIVADCPPLLGRLVIHLAWEQGQGLVGHLVVNKLSFIGLDGDPGPGQRSLLADLKTAVFLLLL